MASWLEDVQARIWPRPKPKPEPVPAPAPEPAKPASTLDYIKAWQLFKKIPLHKLAPAVAASSVVVFFAISGLFAWIAVFLRLMLEIMFMFRR